MHHEAHVLLVDPHPKRRCRNYDVEPDFVGNPFALVFFAGLFVEAGVVGCCADIVQAQAAGEVVALGAKGCIDYARDSVEALGFGGEFGLAGWVGRAAGVDGLQPGEKIGEA